MFTKRTSKPGNGNKNYIVVSSGGWNDCVKGKCKNGSPDSECNALANCVGYASGRINEVYNELFGATGRHYSNLNCNAENFIERAKKNGLSVSDTPVKGGIMVWQKGTTLKGSDGAGHVAFVEDYDGTTVYTSESGYGSTAFWNSKRTNSNGRYGLGSGYKYRGCIYSQEIVDKIKSLEDEAKKKAEEEAKAKEQATKVDNTIKLGDTVLVNGSGCADSWGKGLKTKKFVDRKMKVIKIVSDTSRSHRYALNQYNKGDVGNVLDITAWFSEKNIKKV